MLLSAHYEPAFYGSLSLNQAICLLLYASFEKTMAVISSFVMDKTILIFIYCPGSLLDLLKAQCYNHLCLDCKAEWNEVLDIVILCVKVQQDW